MGEPGKLNLGLVWGAATPCAAPAGGTWRPRVSRKPRALLSLPASGKIGVYALAIVVGGGTP